mgnify:CR=1 FL=1
MRLPLSALSLALAATALTACGETVPADQARESSVEDVTIDEPQIPPIGETASEETPDERFASAYGTLDLDQCEVLTQQEEGEGATFLASREWSGSTPVM